MSENKKEEEIVIEALKKEYLSRIAKELDEELTKKDLKSYLREIKFDEDGEIQFRIILPRVEDTYPALRVCINYLASQLSTARAKQWLKDYQREEK